MSTHHSHRRIPSAVKLTTKGQRPGLPRALSSPKIASSLGKKRTTEVETEIDPFDSEDDMTFLQYCPTCDKQIVVPNTSILYCSESCRRKDALSTSPSPPSFSPIHRMSHHDPSTTRTIVPPREPSTRASFSSKPPEMHSAKTDLDPSEWKPNLRTSPRGSTAGPANSSRPTHARTHSAAQAYLAGFHRDSGAVSCTPRNPAASTAPGNMRYHRAGGSTSGSSYGSVSTSRESSVVGTPGDGIDSHMGRPLVYSASSATMSLDVKNAGEVDSWSKDKSSINGSDVEGALRRMLDGAR